jgi:foldase protein PrsA
MGGIAMFKRILSVLLVALLILSAALAEPEDAGEVARLQAQIAELERENAELRELLSQEGSARLLAARFNGGVITVAEAKAEYEYRAYVYASMGMDKGEYEDIIKEEVLSDLTEDAILMLKAKELGVYAPGDGEYEEIVATAQASYDEMIEYYLPFLTDPEKSDDENRAAVEEYLASEGMTLESQIESMRAQAWRDRLYARATEELQFGDDELRAYFDDACEAAQLTYSADPESYETDRMNGESVLWNPDGYRKVKRILVAFDGDTAARMDEIFAALEEISDEAAVNALLAEMDGLYRTLDPIVEEIMQRIEAGDDFNLLIDEYGDDPFMRTAHGREDGYYVHAESALLDEVFVLEAMALERPGDTSGVIEGQDGAYILRYEADVPAGPVRFDAFLSDEGMRARVEESARREHYNALVEGWLGEADIERFPENF